MTGAAPYRHFADRNELIGELARRGFEIFGESLSGAWDEGKPDARIALKRIGQAYLPSAPAEARTLFGDVQRSEKPGVARSGRCQ